MTTKSKNSNIDPSKIVEFTGKIYGNPRFYDSNSSFGVVVISTQDDVPYAKKTLDYDINSNDTQETRTIVVAGKIPEPDMDAIYKIRGVHKFVEKFKQHQYEIISMISVAPKSVDDCKTYLQSLCTEKQVEVMLNVYPNIVQDIIDGKDDYVDLGLLNGIGDVTWEKIKDKVISNFAIADVINLLVPLGISFNKLKKLLDDEPNPQILKEKLLRNPYKITEISGITFKTADKIATQLNTNFKNSEERLISFVKYFLEEIGNSSGDTYISIEKIRDEVIENVPEVEKYLNEYIQKEIENPKFLHIEDDKIGLKYFYDSEKLIIEILNEINNSVPLEVTEEAIQIGIKKAQEKLGFLFTDEQLDAIKNTTKNNFSILTSKSGCGKTSITRGILDVYNEMGYTIYIAALAAKAAIRSQEVTGYSSSTIHRMLGSKGTSFDYNEDNKLECDVLILEECSMINTILFKDVLKAIDTERTKVIFVGDYMQLSPLSCGNTFYDLINNNSYNFMIQKLTKIQRQAMNSAIIVDGNKIRDGISPIEEKLPRIVHGVNNDLYYLFKSDAESIFNTAISSYISSAKQKGIENVVILSPRKKGTLNSTAEMNKEIQMRINSENENIKFVHGDKSFWLNDRVINIKNNYKKSIFNGEIGTIIDITNKEVTVEFLGRNVIYTHTDIDELDLAYCLTIHKVQGSEYSDVIIVLDNSHFMLLSNQLIYTAVTRSKERCLIISTPYAFDKGLEENKTQRNTWTKEGFITSNIVDSKNDFSQKKF